MVIIMSGTAIHEHVNGSQLQTVGRWVGWWVVGPPRALVEGRQQYMKETLEALRVPLKPRGASKVKRFILVAQ